MAIMDRLDIKATERFEMSGAYTAEVAVEQTVRRFCLHVAENKDVLAGIVIQGVNMPDSTARGMKSSRTIGRLFHGFLTHYLGPNGPRYEVVFRMVYGMMWRFLLTEKDSEAVIPLSNDQFIDGMVDMAKAYIFSSANITPPPADAAHAIQGSGQQE
jgi:hypothetical protein